MLELDSRQQLARELDTAFLKKQSVGRITSAHPDLTLRQAYMIQAVGIELRQGRGERVVGYKMGLTSKAKQQQMRLNTPICGVLTNQMAITHNTSVATAQRFIHPKVEVEIAFILARDLSGQVTAEEALAACQGVCVALEIVDTRYPTFDFNLVDVVADNCSASGFVLGPDIQRLSVQELQDLAITFKDHDTILETASTKAVLENPVNSLIALAELLANQGHTLKAGSVVLSGSATTAYDLIPGMRVHAEVEKLGNVAITAI